WVTQGSPVVEIISRGQIDALVDVPERLINQVRIGDSLELTIEPLGLVCTGEVVSVTPYGGNAARTFPVKIRLGDRGGALKAGMSVVAHLPMGEPSPKLTVPRDAVLFRPAGAVVWAAVQGGGPMPTASAVRVQVLFGEKDRYVIDPSTDALAQGTPVVIEGAERLMEGQPLMILESPVSAEAGSAAPPQNLVASGG
ncbi:MAG TPA: efflux RND transporter periplasmic adaptor subunit, partial [Phycisphaeraceae bacterium]